MVRLEPRFEEIPKEVAEESALVCKEVFLPFLYVLRVGEPDNDLLQYRYLLRVSAADSQGVFAEILHRIYRSGGECVHPGDGHVYFQCGVFVLSFAVHPEAGTEELLFQ